MNEHETGICLVVSAPSGGGKTTVIYRLMQKFPQLKHSISYTTREPRTDKSDLNDYHFISKLEFDSLRDNAEFFEWAEVHGNLYGTRKSDLLKMINTGWDMILDIDVQGARQMRTVYPEAVYIFIMPPSFEVLESRLRRRASDSTTTIKKRLENALVEMQCAIEYDYIVINEDLENTIDQIGSIVLAEKCKTTRALFKISWALRKKEEKNDIART